MPAVRIDSPRRADPAEPRGDVPLGLHPGLGPPPPTAPVGERPWSRRHSSTLATLAGLAAATAGAVLAALPAPAAVHLDADGYHVGTTVLRPTRPGTFENGAVVVIAPAAADATDAGSSLDFGGAHVTASCHMRGAAEHCSFRIGAKTLEADDRLTSSGGEMRWERTYSDGRTVTIAIPNGVPVPAPIPFGR